MASVSVGRGWNSDTVTITDIDVELSLNEILDEVETAELVKVLNNSLTFSDILGEFAEERGEMSDDVVDWLVDSGTVLEEEQCDRLVEYNFPEPSPGYLSTLGARFDLSDFGIIE